MEKPQIELSTTKDELLEAVRQLYAFSENENYQENLDTLTSYISDITNAMLQYKKMLDNVINAINSSLSDGGDPAEKRRQFTKQVNEILKKNKKG